MSEPTLPPNENRSIYFDDLSVGQRFVSQSHQLDEGQVVAFARQFDPQPFHTDRHAAAGTFFGTLVASGWHTVAIAMRLLVQGGLPVAGGVVGAGAQVEWPRPTSPDALLHVESEVVELRPLRSRTDRGMAVVRSETKNAAGETVQVLTSKLVVPRRANA